MYTYIKRICVPLLVAIGYTVMSTASVEARLVYSTEEDGVHTPAFYLNQDDTSDDFVDLNFGSSSGAQLRYDVINDDFTVNKDLDLAAQELQNFKIERLASAPTCDASSEGRMYFNTTSSQTFVCDGTAFNVLENAGAITGADITDGSIGDEDLDLADITLADFTNDAGFVTTDNDTTYTAGTGLTLTGTTFSNDLGTDIATGEIQDNAITSAKVLDATLTADDLADDAVGDAEIDYAAVTLADFTNDAGFLTAETQDISLVGSDLSISGGSTIDLSVIDTDTDTTYTGSGGITLTGTNFTADLGTDIDVSEIVSAGLGDANKILTTDGAGVPQWEVRSNFATAAQGALADSALQSGDNISALVNDAGYVTTDNDTTYTAGTGLTLTGTTFSNDLGTNIDDTELDFGSITLADFTNDAGFLTTEVDGSVTNELQDLSLTGDTLSLTDDATTVDLSGYLDNTDELASLSCASGEIAKWNGTAWACAADAGGTSYTAGTGLTLTGTSFSSDLGTDIDVSEIVSAGLGDANKILTTDGAGVPQWEVRSNFATAAQGALADSALQSGDNVSELTNDAGYLTAETQDISLVGSDLSISGGSTIDLSVIDTDTTYTGSGGITLTGTNFTADLGTSIDGTEIETDAVGDDEIDYAAVTLADFTNDAGFLTTEVDGSVTNELQDLSLAGNTLSLTDDATTVDLSAYLDNTDAQDLTLTGNTLALTNDGTTVDLSSYLDNTDELAGLSCALNEVAKWNGSAWACAADVDTDTTYTGSGGITLTGTNFTADLGTAIETGEITDGTITFADLNNTDITLADFTNDAGFLTAEVDASVTNELQDLSLAGNTLSLTDDATTVDLSAYLDNTDAQDLTLTGNTLALTNDGTTVDLSSYLDNTDELAGLSCALNEVAKWNGSAWACAADVDTDTDTTYTGSGGITLTGTNFTADLGTDIDVSEIVSAGLGDANKILTTDGAGVPQWEVRSNFATAAQGALADSALQSGDNISELVNDAGYVTTDNDTTYSAGTGLTLTGTTFSNDLGTSIDDTELDFGSVTLADFTNDAGFVTTDNDTTYTGSGGITLTGTNFTADLGTSIDATEIETDAVGDDEIDYAAVTLADFTNDAGFITTDNDTTYTGSGGITLTGTNFTADLGMDIDVSEIVSAGLGDANKILTTDGAGVPQWEVRSNFATSAQGALADSALQSGDNISELVNDAGFVTTDNDTTYTAGTGLTLTGTTFSNDLGTSIDDTELDFGSVTLADFTNDAGFLTTEVDGSVTNELQDLSLAGNTLSLTDDATTVDLSAYLDNTDAQDLTLTGNTLALTNDGTTVDLSSYLDNTDELAGLSCALNEVAKWNGSAWACAADVDTDTTYTGSGGITLTGTNFTADLGTSIETAELGDDQVTVAKIGGAGNNQVLTSDGAGNPQWEDKSNFVGSSLTNNNILVGVGGVATDTAVSGDLSMIGGNFQLGSNVVGDAEIDYSAVTLADFTNDVGFITAEVDGSVTNELQDLSLAGNTLSLTDDATTVDLSSYLDNTDELAGLSCALNEVAKWNGSAWACAADVDTDTDAQDLTLTGNTLALTNDGTTVDLSVYLDNTDAQDLTLTGNTLALTNDGTTVDLSSYLDNTDELAGLSCALNEVAKWNGSAWACAADVDTDTTYSAGTGINLVGTTFSSTLGTSVDAAEIDTNAVADDEIDYSAVTLADFTNDVGFITSDSDTLDALSCALNEVAKWNGSAWACAADAGGATYTASNGITLTGSNFTNDFGTTIETGEITDGTITFADLNNTDITLADFTNDAGFVTTDNDTTYTAGTGLTLTGTTFSNDLGTSIETGEIGDNEVTLSKLADGGADQVLTTDGTGNPQWEDKSNFVTSALATANILVGNGSNVATAVDPTGDVEIAADGTTTIEDNSVDGTDIALGSDIAGDIMFYNGTDWARLAAGSAGEFLTTGATPAWSNVDTLQDADGNTSIQVEEGANDDTIRFDTAGIERMVIEADGDLLFGAAAETIDNPNFVMDGNDVFMAGSLGVEGAIYTDATATKYESINVHGCVLGSATLGTVGGGNAAAIRFDRSNDSEARCAVAVPDDWQAGTDISLQVFWSPSDTGSGTVDLDLLYAAFAAGETISAGAFADGIAADPTVTAGTELDIYQTDGIVPAAGLALDDMLNFNLRREGGDVADTYNADINIHMIRLAYTGKRLE